jgi:predicted GNAT superfamily acetyltransferase
VLQRLKRDSGDRLTLAHYLAADVTIINQLKLNEAGFPAPYQDRMDTIEDPETRPNLTLFEIPGNFQDLKAADMELARTWRMYSRVIFELFFNHGYLITDFVFLPGKDPRGYYVLTHGEATIGP